MIFVILSVVFVLLILRVNHKYKTKTLWLLFAIVLVIFAVLPYSDKYMYAMGKDTKEAFGNGAYQLVSGPEYLSLYNEQYRKTIIDRVDAYLEKDGLVFITGIYNISGNYAFDDTNIFAVINPQNNFLTICLEPTVFQYTEYRFEGLISNREAEILSEFSEFPEDIQTVFHNM